MVETNKANKAPVLLKALSAESERNGSGSTVKKINRIRVTAFFHFGMWDDNRGSRFQSLGTGRMEGQPAQETQVEAGLVPYSVKGFILSNVSNFLSNSFLLYVFLTTV
ncbi:hypothetical protein ACOSQ2_003186 [Xanthoceras sorbifolium]